MPGTACEAVRRVAFSPLVSRQHTRICVSVQRCANARVQNANQRVNEALSNREKYNCTEAMLATLRPRVRHPTLSRLSLKELQGMLCDVLREQEAAWE